jgi:hypothetical protein
VPRSDQKRAITRTAFAAGVWLVPSCLASCDRTPAPGLHTETESSAEIGSAAAAESTASGELASSGFSRSAPSAQDDHAGHDCATAHPRREPDPPITATALTPDARARLTTVRISAHVGYVILRKRDSEWITSGQGGCVVPASRVERALDNLASLTAVPSDERPADGNAFELQLTALTDEGPALRFDVAGRNRDGDLVQLNDHSRYRVQGLDRELWSPDPAPWCSD